jgi:glycosyltransferase involved in cell wall biosynthesis
MDMNPAEVRLVQAEFPSEMPLVTVILCVYNAGEYLRPSLSSIIEQTYRNLDILVVDDGSTDGCIDSVRDLLADYRIRLFRQENSTKPVALNRALEHARGTFYAIHDADDVSHPARIERQLRALLDRPTVAAVFCGNELIIEGKRLAPVFTSKNEVDCKHEIDNFRMPAHDPTVMFRMSLVGDLQYDPSMQMMETFDYILRVGEQHPILVLGECLYSYRILTSSVTRRDPMKREHSVTEALRSAYIRRGMEYDRVLPRRPSKRSKNSIMDNNLAAHFMTSVLDQRAVGNRWGALKTAWECARLHPSDLHYYKAMVYAVAPDKVISFIRRRRPAGNWKKIGRAGIKL